MEGNISNEINSKITQNNTEEGKFEQIKTKKNRIYFNSVTGEIMNIDDGNEADMYEVVPDMEQYAEDNINQYIDICEKDKELFNLWNFFIKSKENNYLKFEDILINFLNKYSKYICENNLKRNFVLHLICTYDNRKFDSDNLGNIIDIMDKLFDKYDK